MSKTKRKIDERIMIRASSYLRAALEAAAKNADQTVSEYIRSACEDSVVRDGFARVLRPQSEHEKSRLEILSLQSMLLKMPSSMNDAARAMEAAHDMIAKLAGESARR